MSACAAVLVACQAGRAPNRQRGHDGRRDEKGQDHRVQGEVHVKAPIGLRDHLDQRGVQRERDGDGGGAPAGRQRQALGGELATEAFGACAKREPQRHLRLSCGAARQEEIGEIRTRDQQQHADRRQHGRQRL